MSRRTIFLLAAAVVMLYFGIILFMLSPLNGAKNNVYYRHGLKNNFGFLVATLPSVVWCKELSFQPVTGAPVALVSYPGSGNTWMRYLLQQATGIYTGSIYMDHGLKNHGFPAENVTDASVLVVKTHAVPPIELNKYKSAILLVRNPKDAILADFNRHHKGHIGTAPRSAFLRKSTGSNKIDWPRYVSAELTAWHSFHQLWLTRFPAPVHVVHYEDLVSNTRRTLRGVLAFLGRSVSEANMDCAITNKEGIYRRKKHLNFDPYTAEMTRALEEARIKVNNLITAYQQRHSNSTASNHAG